MRKDLQTEQMTLFATENVNAPPPPSPVKERRTTRTPSEKAPARTTSSAAKARKPARGKGEKRGSGLVPEGDVRLTANIREDLHLRLKIAAAKQRTTIGELIEGLVEKHI